MAKTKRSKKRLTKTRSKSSKSHRIEASLLLAVLDELNELAGLLRCVPELNILSDTFRERGHEMEENEASEKTEQTDLDHDRIATAAMEHFGRNLDVIDQEERDKNAIDYDARFGIDPPMYARELVGVPEAVIDAVRWRLQRLRAVLEMLH